MRLFKRKGGRVWYCQFYENGERAQRSTRCHDRKAAEAVARDFERAGADPDHARTNAATLSDALRLLIEHHAGLVRAGRRAPETLTFYKSQVGTLTRLFEYDAGGVYVPFPLAELRARDVDKFISMRRAEGAKDITIAKQLVALRLSLKLANRAGIWRGDPAAVCPVGFTPDYVPRKRSLSRDELNKLLGKLTENHAARVAFIVATSACWRETERAQRGDVAGDRALVRGTKRKTRFRTVPLVTVEQRTLAEYAVQHGKGAGDLLFAPWLNVRHDLEKACERAGIARCSPNDLRRTCANWLRAAGAAPDLLAPLMGHKDTRMVERVYGRLSTDDLSHRLSVATGSLDLLAVRWILARLAAVLELAGCSAGAAAKSDLTVFGASLVFKNAGFSAESVPRDGIEPPTRGFSNVRVLWATPRKETQKNAGMFGGAASVQRRTGRFHKIA